MRKMNLQFFAESAGSAAGAEPTAGAQGQQIPSATGGQQNVPPAVDYTKIQQMLEGTLAAKEDTALKAYFKQQGLSEEEMKQAIAAFKQQKAASQPDVSALQTQAAQAQAMAQQAMLEKEATLTAISLGLDAKIFPFLVDATKELPFAHEYFDMIISVDSYQYFGGNEAMLPKLLSFVKRGGFMAVAVPGFIQDFPEGRLPEEIQPFWTPEWYFYSRNWWRALWEKEPGITITHCREMDSCRQAWEEWLKSPNPHAQGDIPMMEAGAGNYFNMVQMAGRKI